MTAPFISCIVTAFAEGPLAAVAIDSLLSQSFTDFELLIVDDGASEETRRVLHSYEDRRIRHIRQANDGLSSARNRALISARGTYICFLDADDSRPAWAFAEMARAVQDDPVDVLLTAGLLSELRNEILPFYDQDIFRKLAAEGLERGASSDPGFARALRLLTALEPQSANKLIKRSFLEKQRLRFPAGLFFEDVLFHNAMALGMASYATLDLPCFTYFRRYGRPQITGSTGTIRFDSISSAANTLELFARSGHFQDPVLRMVVVAATFKLLQWCEDSVSHVMRWQFRQALLAMTASLDPRLRPVAAGPLRDEAAAIAPWVNPALDYATKVLEAVPA